MPLFSRLERDEALENPRRSLILRHVEEHPGCRFHELKRELDLTHGVLVHHLRVLARERLLILDRDGRRLRIRLPGQRLPPPLDPQLARLVETVRASPGLSIKEAAERLGWTRRTTSYRVEALVRRGALRSKPDGLHRRLEASASAEITNLMPTQAIDPA